MEDGGVELKRGKRRRMTTNAIERQKRIAKQSWNSEHLLKQPHRFAKHHATNCGIPRCVMCGNPRRVFGEKTIQEKRFEASTGDYNDYD